MPSSDLPVPVISSYHTLVGLITWNVPSSPLGDRLIRPSSASGAVAIQKVFCSVSHFMRDLGISSKYLTMLLKRGDGVKGRLGGGEIGLWQVICLG